MSDGLPQGWAATTLGDLVDIVLGGDWGNAPDVIDKDFARVRVIRGTEFKFWRDEKGASAAKRSIKITSLTKRRLQKNDIVLEVSGGGPNQPVARTVLIDDEALTRADLPLVCSNFFRFLRLHSEADPRFVNHFLSYAYTQGLFNEFQTETTNLRNLNVPDFLEVDVLIAPLKEQRRIVAKLEMLLGKMDSCEKRLAKIPVILKRFRQSVLAVACSGRLTADWRETNLNVGAIRRVAQSGRGTASPLQNSGADLPEGWSFSQIDKVSESLKYGTSQKCSYEKKGVPVLRIPNIEEGVIGHTDLKYADLPVKEFQQLCLQPGDILIVRSNGSVSLVGKSALVREAEKNFAYAGYLIRIRPDRAMVLPQYLNLALGSYDVRLQIEVPARSTSGVNNINSDELRALSFNLPPLPEQQEIVRRVEALFALADQIEARYTKAKAFVDKLTQSILAKAFRGELVPQDPNDEPASALLERIKSERLQQKPEKNTGKGKRQSG